MPMRRRMGSASSPGSLMSTPSSKMRAVVDGLEQVDAAQQRALARAAGADEADHLVLADVERHVVEHDLALGFLPNDFSHVADARASARHATTDPPVRLRCRAVYQSTRRVSGMVRMRKMSAAATSGVKLPDRSLMRRRPGGTPR